MISRADILLIVGIMILAIAGLFVWKKICEKHRAISQTGETIICLPHKLVVEIKE